MIAKDYVTAWRLHAPWISDHQVEQDLVISRALAQIFGVAELERRLAFCGRKGRDLFDIWFALTSGGASAERVVSCLDRYLREAGRRVTRAAFEENLAGKLAEPLFRSDMTGLLRPGFAWDIDVAGAYVMEHVLARLDGEPWKCQPA